MLGSSLATTFLDRSSKSKQKPNPKTDHISDISPLSSPQRSYVFTCVCTSVVCLFVCWSVSGITCQAGRAWKVAQLIRFEDRSELDSRSRNFFKRFFNIVREGTNQHVSFFSVSSIDNGYQRVRGTPCKFLKYSDPKIGVLSLGRGMRSPSAC